MNSFLLAVEYPFLNQVYNAVRKHLAVHSQVLVLVQRRQNRSGNGADSCLQSRTIFYQVRAGLTDG